MGHTLCHHSTLDTEVSVVTFQILIHFDRDDGRWVGHLVTWMGDSRGCRAPDPVPISLESGGSALGPGPEQGATHPGPLVCLSPQA